MKIYTTLFALALLLAVDTAGAVRIIEQVERGVELTLDQLSLPSSDTGTVSFRPCPACTMSTHRLTASTVFTANGQVVPFAEMLRVAEEIRGKPNGAERAMAVVFLDIATSRITRIEIRE